MEDEERILKEAEKQLVLKEKKAPTPKEEEEANKLREQQKKYLPQALIKSEKKKLFKVDCNLKI